MLLEELCDFDLAKAMTLSENPLSSFVLSQKDLIEVCAGIIDGMIHLSAFGIIHRDLASRNVFLKNKKSKIGDFGLSIIVDSTGVFVADKDEGMWKEQPPEVVNSRRFSMKSDVWAFGLIVWCLYVKILPIYDYKTKDDLMSFWEKKFSLEKQDTIPSWM